MQQLNATTGGTLYPPVADDQPCALAHRQSRHPVLLESGTRIEELYGRDEISVNNQHRQTVRRVGNGLRVSGLAPDGVIEAIEAVGADWFCVGVQWHPEAEGPDFRLFEGLVEASARAARPEAVAA
jgi:putative glutamine amidotransferase